MNDKLFGDIGRKIKVLAIVSFYVLTILSIVLGIILIAANDGLEDGWWALFIIFFGPIVALILSWILYGFGELVENTQAIRSFPVSGINNNLQLLVDPIISENREKAEREFKETAKQKAEEIAKQDAEFISDDKAGEGTHGKNANFVISSLIN